MKPIDWPAMIHQLNESGITQKQIQYTTGITQSTLTRVKNETMAHSEAWDQALELFDLYLKTTGTPPPRLDDGVQF
jgi:hypothetical protein